MTRAVPPRKPTRAKKPTESPAVIEVEPEAARRYLLKHLGLLRPRPERGGHWRCGRCWTLESLHSRIRAAGILRAASGPQWSMLSEIRRAGAATDLWLRGEIDAIFASAIKRHARAWGAVPEPYVVRRKV